jgi:hypothetical protein
MREVAAEIRNRLPLDLGEASEMRLVLWRILCCYPLTGAAHVS